MIKQFLLLNFISLIVLKSCFAYADTVHNYEELQIHNPKIEARIQDWMHRAKAHALDLDSSTHYQISNWRSQMKNISFENELEGLHMLNTLINGDVEYRDDYSHFHLKDYWADPETTLDEGGDCEDIALLKAASLYRLKWPSKRMHLLLGYLMERGKHESHAVLLVETSDGSQFILRSITDQVIPPDKYNFIPIYAVDGEGAFIVKLPKKSHELKNRK